MQFLHTMLEPFSLTGLLEFLGESTGTAAREELSDFLVFNQLAYLSPSFDDNDELWLTRAGLFTGKPLVVIPSRTEIASGVLVPGSRFVPFYDSTLLPNELIFIYRGKTLPRVKLDVSSDEVYPHYMLFGEEYIPQYLALDNEENSVLFSPSDYDDPPEFPVSAVDMRSVYWDSHFVPGDHIVARVVDWGEGVFELAAVSSGEIDLAKHGQWLEYFEECLTRSFEIVGPGAGMDEQLAFAWFLGQDSLFTPYAASVAEFLQWSHRVSIEYYGVESRLWFTGQTIPSQDSWNMTLVVSPNSMVEELFMHLGLPVSDTILDVCILDALFRKETSVAALIERLVPNRNSGPSFCVPLLERALGLRFKELASGYNWFADHDTGVLRNRFVELHNALSTFIISLKQTGIRPDIIPEQGAVVLGQLMSHTVSALEEFAGKEIKSPADIEALWASIEGMEESFFDTKTSIIDILPELKKKSFSVIKTKEKPHD